jgi:hypothetical protein
MKVGGDVRENKVVGVSWPQSIGNGNRIQQVIPKNKRAEIFLK